MSEEQIGARAIELDKEHLREEEGTNDGKENDETEELECTVCDDEQRPIKCMIGCSCDAEAKEATPVTVTHQTEENE